MTVAALDESWRESLFRHHQLTHVYIDLDSEMSWDVSALWPFFAFILILNLPKLRSSLSTSSTDRPKTIPDAHYHPSSPQDVFKVRGILLQFFPPELANLILEEAEYWPRLVGSKVARVVVDSARSKNNDASVCYLITPPIPSAHELGGSDARLCVKRVEFYILSHDQGWSNATEFHGTYEGSFTWFEASILRPAGTEEEEEMTSSPARGLLHGWTHALGFSAKSSPRPRPSPSLAQIDNPNEDSGRWHIQTNRCAHAQSLLHTVIWGVGGDWIGDSENMEEHNCNGPGSGAGAGFLEMLAPGDRIGVIARAKFPRWVNFVSTVKVVVYYSV